MCTHTCTHTHTHTHAHTHTQFRYTLLTLAALEAPLVLPLGEKGLYGQDCIFLANDWCVFANGLLRQDCIFIANDWCACVCLLMVCVFAYG